MKKILVTGFEAFFDDAINPSQQVLPFLKCADAQLCFYTLPVSFSCAHQQIMEQVKIEKPEALLMLGQAAGRKKVALEKIALNIQFGARGDAESPVAIDRTIDLSAPLALANSLPLNEWASQAQAEDLPLEISFFAGVYVCNSIYFQSLQAFAASHEVPTGIPVLFVHLPYLPEQVIEKPGIARLSLAEMAQTINWIIKKLS